jgi:hypothetical protein
MYKPAFIIQIIGKDIIIKELVEMIQKSKKNIKVKLFGIL